MFEKKDYWETLFLQGFLAEKFLAESL